MKPTVPSEKDVLREVDAFASAFGFTVVRLEQRRASKQHVGLPDRRYQHQKGCFFFEGKAPNGRLTPEQYAFLKAELEGGALASCGGLAEFREVAGAITLSQPVRARNACWKHLERLREKGWRGCRRPVADSTT